MANKETTSKATVGQDNLTITTTVKALETVFDKANTKFYNNELTRPVITFSPVVKRNSINYGHFVCGEVWHKGDLNRCEININCIALESNDKVVGTMLHEMAHAYNYMKGVKDCSGSSNAFHNKAFKETAEAHGLNVERSEAKSYGWSETTLNDKGKKFADSIKDDLVALKRDKPKAKQTTSRNISYKYVCPMCGNIARTTKEMRLTCTDCECEMIEG